MQPQYKKSASHQAQRGTSLIEILVVLVILVVGILSIVRLFPAGFIALRNAENDTFADRLAQGALEQLKKSGNGLPDAIYMYSTADGFIPTFAPTDFNKTYTPTGANTANAAYNDINKQRYISNETITVPAPHVIAGSNGTSVAYPPLYVVNYGPIYLPKEYATLATPAVSVRYLPINSLPWTQQIGDSRPDVNDPNVPQRSIDNPVDILQTGQPKYLADENAGALAVPQAGYNQVFYVQVTQKMEGQGVPIQITIPATVPATGTNPPSGYDGNWFSSAVPGTVTGAASLPVSTTTDPWIAVTVYRPFQYMGIYGQASALVFDNDPYEFKIFNGMGGGSSIGTDSNMGVIAFNPLAAGQNGSQPLKARISYMTLDWHILHEDQSVAAGSPSVRLTLNHLKKIGDTQFDQTIYNGLIPDATTPSDLMMLDLDTGTVTNLAAPQNGSTTGITSNLDDSTGPAAGNGIYQVSYQNGRITFPDKNSDGTTRGEQHLRFFDAGDADWALAIRKAPSVYNLVNLPGGLTSDAGVLNASGSATPNNYFVDPATSRVYFPICDAGKTVEFDGISYTNMSGTTKQIGEATAPISTDYAANGLPYVNLANTGLDESGIITDGISTSAAGPLTFQAVRGISAQATVIWHERNQWRTRTIDTLLTQTQ